MQATELNTVLAAVGAMVLTVMSSAQAQDAQRLDGLDAAAVVEQLRHVPSSMPASVPSSGIERPAELLRRQIYDRLLVLSPASIHALARGLQDPDVEFRRNAALALGVLSGHWWSFGGETHSVDLSVVLPELLSALTDPDSTVRAWVAQDIGNIGASAVSAVPQLIALLENGDEAARNSSCIALRRIGPPAVAALPALQRALSDPSADVRKFAALAIESIEGQR